MPRSARYLLDAVDRYPRSGHAEDRLTELFAHVLASVRQLASWLVDEAYETRDAADRWLEDGYEVLTQQWVSPRARPDMVIRFLGAGPGGRLVVEHKLWALQTDAQLRGYEDLDADDRTLAIVPSGYDPPAAFDRVLTWSQVANAAQRIGAELAPTGSRRWRQELSRDDALAAVLRLAELIEYLVREETGVDAIEALGTHEIAVFARARRALIAAERVFDEAADRLVDRLGTSGDRSWRYSWTPGVPHPSAKGTKDSWFQPLGHLWPAFGDNVWAEFLLSAYDDWMDESLGEPAFAAGYTFDLAQRTWPAGLAPSDSFRSTLRSREPPILVCEGDDGGAGRCIRTLYLAELAAHGRTLADQAAYVANWAQRTIEEIAATSPS